VLVRLVIRVEHDGFASEVEEAFRTFAGNFRQKGQPFGRRKSLAYAFF
jgi:hypothetical protein